MFLCALVCVLPTTSAVGAAQAQPKKPRFEVHQRSLRLSARVEASNGYRGWIRTEGHRRVTLTLVKGRTAIEARTSGRVTRHGIEAQFGDMGRISVRFRGEPVSPDRRNGDGERRCRGRKSRFEEGRFNGTIRFRGENDFTRMNLKRAAGSLERHYRRVCREDPSRVTFDALLERLTNSLRFTTLHTGASVAGANIVFQATVIDFRPLLGPEFGPSYVFSAQTVERVSGTRLTRSVGIEGNDESFLYPRRKGTLRRATVTPPKPFTGTAEYVKRAGSPSSWIGSLAARLPGVGLVAMTGPKFKAEACNLTFAALLAEGRCLPGSGPLHLQSHSSLGLDLAQGSGSQSQAFWEDRLSWSR